MPRISLAIGEDTHVLDTDTLMITDLIALKKFTAFENIEKLSAALQSKDMEAVQAMVWLARRAAGEKTLRVDEVDFPISALRSATTAAEQPADLGPTAASLATSSGSPITSASIPGTSTA